MIFRTECYTDQGGFRPSNQDALAVKTVQTGVGQVAWAVICDGMGGLEQGEIASTEMVLELEDWFDQKFPELIQTGLQKNILFAQWEQLLKKTSQQIFEYGERRGIRLGTTVTILLIWEDTYFLMHVGDCRVYRIDSHEVRQITEDQTLAAREYRAGNITAEEFKKDHRQNILLQCIGSGKSIFPETISGKLSGDMAFLLCSDGFYHQLSENELLQLAPVGENELPQIREQQTLHLLQTCGAACRARGETDNLTAITVFCYDSSCGPTRLMDAEEPFIQVLAQKTVVHGMRLCEH